MSEPNSQYTVSEVSEKLQIPQSTLRYFCNSGLIPAVRRNRLGHRIFEEWQLDHIRVMLGLRQAGFTKSDLKRYAHLVRQGELTLSERKALMETQKRQLWQQLEGLQQGIDFLERQIEQIDQSQKEH